MRIAVFGVMLSTVVAAGCAINGDDGGSLLVQPGKYQYLRCQDIAKRSAELSAREKELAGLMERAKEGVGGQFVSAVVYSADFEQARADMRQLRLTAQEKNCDLGGAPGAHNTASGLR